MQCCPRSASSTVRGRGDWCGSGWKDGSGGVAVVGGVAVRVNKCN